MLEKSDINIASTLAMFNAAYLDVGLIVPTETGITKSIMDSTASIRDHLAEKGFHDYDTQEKGPDYKVIRNAFFVWPDRLENTTVSLYRPMTKNGDPRIWFSKMKSYADPYNLLAIIVHEDALYLVNCSVSDIMDSLKKYDSPLAMLSRVAQPKDDKVVLELLEMIRKVSLRGFVRTLRSGSTGVGMTLETLLGIAANTSQAPDYKGIELKAKRIRKGKQSTRVTLFSQVPDWKLSPIGSAWNLLEQYGYRNANGRLQFYHEIDAKKSNSLGFMLELDATNDWLKQKHVDTENNIQRHLTTWELGNLRRRLLEKHPQTFWVGARCRGKGDNEEFHYTQIEHTKSPKIRNFDTLLEGGIISVDYTLSATDEMKKTVRDHGYLFKIHPRDFNALFPPSAFYDLIS
ncbi:MAG: MvaI/BcnI family restriction endonuclease [Aggregatilineales bacterium]